MKYKKGSNKAAMANNLMSFLFIFSKSLKINKIVHRKILDIISLKNIVVVGFND